MNEEQVSYEKIIEKYEQNIKKNNRKKFITIIILFIPVLIFIFPKYSYLDNLLLLSFLFIPLLVIIIFDRIDIYFFIKNLKLYEAEIREYCVSVNDKTIFTRNHIIYFNLFKFRVAAFEDIVLANTIHIYSTDIVGPPKEIEQAVIKLKNGKTTHFVLSNSLRKILDKYYSEDEQIFKKDDFEVKPKSKYIKSLYNVGDYYEGCFFFPCFNSDCDIFAFCEPDIIEKTINYIVRTKYDFYKEAIEGTVSFYNAFLKEYGPIDNVPIRIDESTVMNYLKMPSVDIYQPSPNSNTILFTVGFVCPWGSEQRLKWCFQNDRNVYVGDASDVSPDIEYYINDTKYNYALKKHPKETLTEAEYRNLETRLKQKD